MIKNNIFIHPDSKISKSTIIEPFSYIDSNVEIGKNCWISPHCVVDIGCEIGDNCIVGTSSLVRTNFPKNSVVTGSPAKLLRKNV